MKRIYKLVWLLLFALGIQSALLAAEKTANKGFWFFKNKANLEVNNNSNTITAKQFSDIPLKIFLNDTVFIDGVPVYQSCINSQSEITFLNNAVDPTKNTNYIIKWGDNSADFIKDSWENTTHQYTPRLNPYTLEYSFSYPDGSKFLKEYKIYVRSKPAFSFGTEGLTDNCANFDIFFPIKGTESNSPDTKYKIIFNDGSDTINYNPSDGNGGIFHKFLKSSCGTTSSTYRNAFSAKVIAQNACGISEVSVVPIYVSTPPVVGFSLPVSKNTAVSAYPSKVPIKISDNTTGFVNVNGNCSAIPKLVWVITPNIGISLAAGESLGKDYGLDNSEFWEEGTKTISPSFSVPGTYTIKLRVDTKRCGNNFIEKTICIEDPLTTTFSLDSLVGCKPLTVRVNNTTNLSNTCTSAYKWDVIYSASNCGNKAEWTYGNGSNELSPSPVFNFTGSGTYKLRLTMVNTAGSSFYEQTVTVKQPPTAKVDSIPDFCGSASIEPIATVNSCNDSPDKLIYNWTFEGGTPSSSSNKIPGTITYNSVGNYKVKLIVTNDCSSTIAVSNTFTVNPIPTVNIIANQLKCSGDISDEITFEGANGNVYEWTNDNTSIGLKVSGKGDIMPFILQNDSNKVLTANITVTPKNTETGCIGIPKSVTISVNPTAKMDSVRNQVINNGEMTSAVEFISKNIDGETTYTWINENPTNELGASGTGNLSAFKALNKTTKLLEYPITVTPTYTNGGVSCTGDAHKFTITINPTAQINRPQSIDLCNGAYTPDILFSTNNTEGVTTYSWTNNNVSIGLKENGLGNIKNFKLINKTGSNQTAIITVIPTFTYNGISNVGDSVQFTINVDPGPDFTQQPISSFICRGGNASPLVVGSIGGVGTPKYQWYWNDVEKYEESNILETETSNTLFPDVTTAGTKYYYCTITLEEGKCFVITSEIATVSVNEAAMINTHPTAYQNLCVGGTIKTPLKVEFDGGSGEATYEWFSNTQNSNSGGTLILGADSSSFTPSVFTLAKKYYYYVTVKLSGDKCESKTSNVAEINVVNDPTLVTQPLASQTVCHNTPASILVATPQGGVESMRYQYQWYSNSINSNTNGSIIEGASDSIYTPLTDSIKTKYYYCLLQQDSLSCSVISETSTVTVNPNPTIISTFKDTTVCINEPIPALNIHISGGVGTPNYQWYASKENNYNLGIAISEATKNTFLPPTSSADTIYYYCQVSGFTGGCTSLTSEIVNITIKPKAIISAQNISICTGETFSYIKTDSDYIPDGTTFIWSAPIITPANSITGSKASFTPSTEISQTLTNTSNNLATAKYTVTPISGSCNGQSFEINVEVIPSIITSVNLKNSSCYRAHNGSISPTIIGGKPFSAAAPYIFTWTSPNGFTSDKKEISNLQPGEYTLIITDNGGCPFTEKYTITEPTEITITTDSKTVIKCNGDNSGQISITVVGGTPSYTYNWTKDGLNYSTSEDLSNLTVGNYIVAVKDANGCEMQSDTIKISEPEALVVKVTKKDISCFGDVTGQISVEVTGGVPFESSSDYQYQWTGPKNFSSNLNQCSNLSTGDYQLIVTDQNGCTKTILVNISQPEELKLNMTSTRISCSGVNNGSISANITGGTKPYSIVWSHHANGTELTNLLPGIYTITVTDANGCIKSETVNISEANFTIHPTIKNVSCNGANDGSIHLNIAGGVLPIKVRWTDDASAGGERNNLAPGTYTVQLQDGAPCVITETYEISEPEALVIVGKITNAFECNNPNSGAITTTVTGGTMPYIYNWNNGKNTEHLTGIQSGNYTLTVTDAKGCSNTTKFKVSRQLPLVVYVSTTTNFNCETKRYKNVNTAQVSGGVSPYKYYWSSGNVNAENNEIMENDKNNVVVLQVIDAMGCTADFTFTIDNPLEQYAVEIDYKLVDCKKQSYLFDVIDANLSGNLNTYTWDFGDGTTSNTKTTLHSYKTHGNYKVILTKSNGLCITQFEEIVSIEPLPKVKLDKTPVLCRGESAVFYASGANSYLWSDGSTGDSIVLTQNGNYSVIGTSKNGCNDTLNFTASYYDLLNYKIKSDRIEIEVNTPLHLWTDSIAYSTYLWDFGDGTPTVEGIDVQHSFEAAQDGFYNITLKVINPNGCTETDTKKIWITIPTKPSIITPNGDGVNDVFMKDSYLKLYNRNGILIFEGNNGWDGTFKNKTVSNGTYFYVLTISSENGVTTKNGYVTVMK